MHPLYYATFYKYMKNSKQNKRQKIGNEKNSKSPEKQTALKKFLEKLDKAFKETCAT